MDDKEKIRIFDKISSVVNSYCDRLISDGCIDPDNMDQDCFYEPIYGENKLNQIQNNDNRKFQACLEKKIELCIIDTSCSVHFKPQRDVKYLNIIRSIIDQKMRA